MLLVYKHVAERPQDECASRSYGKVGVTGVEAGKWVNWDMITRCPTVHAFSAYRMAGQRRTELGARPTVTHTSFVTEQTFLPTARTANADPSPHPTYVPRAPLTIKHKGAKGDERQG